MPPHRAISLHGLPSVLTRPGLVTRLRALAAEAHTAAAAPSSPRSPSNRRDGFVPIDWKVVDAGSERLELSRNEFQATSALWVGPVPELTGDGVDTPLRRRLPMRDEAHPPAEGRRLPFFSSIMDRFGTDTMESDWTSQQALRARLPALAPWWAENSNEEDEKGGVLSALDVDLDGKESSRVVHSIPVGTTGLETSSSSSSMDLDSSGGNGSSSSARRRRSRNPSHCSMKWAVPEVIAALQDSGISVSSALRARLESALTRVDLHETARAAGERRGSPRGPPRVNLIITPESAADAVNWLRDHAGVNKPDQLEALLVQAPWVLGVPRPDAVAALDCLALLELSSSHIAAAVLSQPRLLLRGDALLDLWQALEGPGRVDLVLELGREIGQVGTKKTKKKLEGSTTTVAKKKNSNSSSQAVLLSALASPDARAAAEFYGSLGICGTDLLHVFTLPGALQTRARLHLGHAWLQEHLGLDAADLRACPGVLARPLATSLGPAARLVLGRGVSIVLPQEEQQQEEDCLDATDPFEPSKQGRPRQTAGLLSLSWMAGHSHRAVAARLRIGLGRFHDVRRAFQADLVRWVDRRWEHDPELRDEICAEIACDIADFERVARNQAHLTERMIDDENAAEQGANDDDDHLVAWAA